MTVTTHPWINAVGRRKTAVVRLFLKPGKGSWEINGCPLQEYFPRLAHLKLVERPLEVTDSQGKYDIRVNARGGGIGGQAGAISLALARALVRVNPDLRLRLREHGLLTRDARMVERKKYGQKKARKRFQFSKR